VREGILKCGGATRCPPEHLAGLRQKLAPLFEVQVVTLADRIAGAVHELDDALQAGALELARAERLGAVDQLRRKLGSSYPSRGGRFMKINVIHRGLIHLLVTGAVLASGRALARWAEQNGVAAPDDFNKLRDERVGGGEIALPDAGRRALEQIEKLLDTQVRRGYAADRVHSRGRHVMLGLFAAYHSDPLLLDDHVLLRYKEIARVRYLRDLSRSAAEAQIAARYRADPRFVRLLADHLASMTDSYALLEHERLMKMGAVPIPGAERLRDERTRNGDAGPTKHC